MTTPTATLTDGLDPGTPEWAARMSASKIAAVLGVAPEHWDSRFSLWHKMAGLAPWDDSLNADEKRRGHYLEPAMRQWWRDQHPAYSVARTGTWVNDERPWQIASPDGLIHDETGSLVGVLECKTSNNDWEWGSPGSDQVPRYYRAQAVWTMDTLGVPWVAFAVLTNYLTFVEYRVEYDPAEAEVIRVAGRDFLDSIHDRRRPELDDAVATHRTIRQMHPDIVDVDVEIPHELAIRYATAIEDVKTAEAIKRRYATEVADRLGDARRALTPGGITVAYRKPVKGGKPCLSPVPGLGARLLLAAPPVAREAS